MDHGRQLSQVPQGTESMAPPRSSPHPTPTAQWWRGGRSCPPTPSTHPPGWTHAALRTGVPVGAGQTVSSHLRWGLVTSVQELLGAEHVAGVSDPVHAVQDTDLGRGQAQWARSLLPGPPPAPEGPALPRCPPASPPGPGVPWAAISIPTHQQVQSIPPRLLASGVGCGRKGTLGTSTTNSLLE